MSSPFFRFRQFTVRHERCAMKVNTDGVLLGAWTTAPATMPLRILDIGTGTGLISLMLAQRFPSASILAIDIDRDATEQASENFDASPWHNRLQAMNLSFEQLLQQYTEPFHLIVSNPPFFRDAMPNPNHQKRTARHTDTLHFSDIISAAPSLLHPNGTAALILPADCEIEALSLSASKEYSLVLQRLTRVRPLPDKPYHRVLLQWSYLPFQSVGSESPDSPVTIRSLTIADAPSSSTSARSADYVALTRDFYL